MNDFNYDIHSQPDSRLIIELGELLVGYRKDGFVGEVGVFWEIFIEILIKDGK